ncbi:hypothetical protein A8H40_09415 [Burkholderia multivorans]|uniref:Uncharacterized protein n=1 Tax=Burkholderia multivorans CGD2 TaxID=513052 RepID=B9BJX9_9BURK|nr:hypothetical protein A8H40_09415 [Burkholderia multivorans]EEE08246.1 hypothetical protein BURMUCGD2_5386 [Burkholderia multivorans CGD2]EEE15932.1 hypothetical protein BURMUCGD2M_5376 [Burkholderia multivorans CGD2M]
MLAGIAHSSICSNRRSQRTNRKQAARLRGALFHSSGKTAGALRPFLSLCGAASTAAHDGQLRMTT